MKCCKCKVKDSDMTIWCPTWITAHEGPMHFCNDCAETFSEKNESAKGGVFLFNNDAQIAFDKVELFLKCNDSRFTSATNTLLKTQENSRIGIFTKVFVLDGKVWLANKYSMLRFGDYFETKQLYPQLFTDKYNPTSSNV